MEQIVKKQAEELIANRPHQYGEFWVTVNKVYQVSVSDFQNVAKELGFRLYRGDIHKIVDGFKLVKTTEGEFLNSMRNYIEDVGQINYRMICNACESFMQKSGNYVIKRLPEIQQSDLLSDTKNECYKFYQNGFLKITATDPFILKDYSLFPKDKYVLEYKISQHNFFIKDELNPNAKYLKFLELSTNLTDNEHYISSIIGYLCHEYKDETTGFIVVLTEKCKDPKDGGGSGKNLFCNLLSYSTTYHSKNGSQLKYDEKFFQSWSGQRIMGISDVRKDFNYEFLKEPATGTFILKKLFKNEIEIPVHEGPKFIVQTNYSYEVTDGGLKRRIIPIEFTDFFTKAGGIDVFFGCHFPTGWSDEDWADYYMIIAASIKTWLASNRKLLPIELSETGWDKQFEYTYGKNTYEFIHDNFDSWLMDGLVKPSKEIKDSLNSFYVENDIIPIHRTSRQRIAMAIKEYAKFKGYECEPNKQIPILGVNTKCYVFKQIAP